MKPITDTKLKEILRLHSLWLEGDPAGQRANLSEVDLSEVDLSGANLYGAKLPGIILENIPVLSFQFNRHTARYFGDGVLQIGCHKHSLAQWVGQYKKIGKINKYTPKEIKAYGDFIKFCIKLTPKRLRSSGGIYD